MSSPRTNPLTWYVVQVLEYLVIIALLERVVPDSTPRWLQVVIFVLVIVGAFVLNYLVVMPRIGRSSRSQRDEPEH
jgi:hypothetical protein